MVTPRIGFRYHGFHGFLFKGNPPPCLHIIIPDLDSHSRKHIRVFHRKDAWKIRDCLGSVGTCCHEINLRALLFKLHVRDCQMLQTLALEDKDIGRLHLIVYDWRRTLIFAVNISVNRLHGGNRPDIVLICRQGISPCFSEVYHGIRLREIR